MSYFSPLKGMPKLKTMPPVCHPYASRNREEKYEKLVELEHDYTDLSVELYWPDEELTLVQKEELSERMELLRDQIEEIKEELGID